MVDCTAAFEASIKDLGASNLGPMDLDATLGLIAAALQTAQTKPQTARRMAAILREAAKIAGYTVQARDMLIVAELVENGRAKEVLSLEPEFPRQPVLAGFGHRRIVDIAFRPRRIEGRTVVGRKRRP